MDRYKIVLISFPFDDLTATKVRPALCLTHPIGPFQHTVVAFVTSQVPDQPLPTDLIITNSHPVFYQTGLKVTSTIRTHRLMTISVSLIKRDLGQLPHVFHKPLQTKLIELFLT